MTVEPEMIDTKTKGVVLWEAWFYAPTCLTDDPTGEVTLFARRFREIEMPSGKRVVRAARSTEAFPSGVEMGEAIEQRHMTEWDDLDANPPLQVLPDGVSPTQEGPQ